MSQDFYIQRQKEKGKALGAFLFLLLIHTKTHSRKQRNPYTSRDKTPRTPIFIWGASFPQIHHNRLLTTQNFLGMLFFLYPTIKRLSPVKRKIKFHDGTQNRDFQGENTPKPTLSKPENTKIGESGGKKAGSQIRKKADSTLKANTKPTNRKPPSIRQEKAAGRHTAAPHL